MRENCDAPFTILVAEDDPDDRVLLELAFKDLESDEKLHFVENGEELIDYLSGRGKYGEHSHFPRPGLILLDLNMPRKDGRQTLREIKSDPRLQDIPVVVWTTSSVEEDISFCRKTGADAYKTKPAAYLEILDAIREIKGRWVRVSS